MHLQVITTEKSNDKQLIYNNHIKSYLWFI